MSAGQSRRLVMSAACPVYPQHQTFPDQVGTSHLCQERKSLASAGRPYRARNLRAGDGGERHRQLAPDPLARPAAASLRRRPRHLRDFGHPTQVEALRRQQGGARHAGRRLCRRGRAQPGAREPVQSGAHLHLNAPRSLSGRRPCEADAARPMARRLSGWRCHLHHEAGDLSAASTSGSRPLACPLP